MGTIWLRRTSHKQVVDVAIVDPSTCRFVSFIGHYLILLSPGVPKEALVPYKDLLLLSFALRSSAKQSSNCSITSERVGHCMRSKYGHCLCSVLYNVLFAGHSHMLLVDINHQNTFENLAYSFSSISPMYSFKEAGRDKPPWEILTGHAHLCSTRNY